MPPCEAGSPAQPGAARPGRAEAAPISYAFTLPARLAAPWAARTQIRGWLERLGFPAELVDDVEYLVSEAVSNAAEHAYPADVADGTIEVDAEVLDHAPHGRQVRVAVRDRGRWQPVDPDPRHRGHGIAAMAAIAQELTIRRAEGPAGGTEIVLVSPVALGHGARSGRTS